METRRVIRKPELFSVVTLSDTTIWRLEKLGRFPKRIKLGDRAVGWFAADIEKWLEAKAAQ